MEKVVLTGRGSTAIKSVKDMLLADGIGRGCTAPLSIGEMYPYGIETIDEHIRKGTTASFSMRGTPLEDRLDSDVKFSLEEPNLSQRLNMLELEQKYTKGELTQAEIARMMFGLTKKTHSKKRKKKKRK